MTLTIAVIGKGGSGKTTVTRNLTNVLKRTYPDKTILLFDNDLTCELGRTYGKDVRKTLYGIRSGKHEYKTGIPAHMSKQEFVEWAIEDIIEPVDTNVDLVVSWLSSSKDCRCPITKQMNDALEKLVLRYDIVIFDCEFDLKYLYQLVDVPINSALIVTLPTEESVELSARIAKYSAKYAAGEQMGVIFNRTGSEQTAKAYELAEKFELETLGVIPEDKALSNGSSTKISKVVEKAIEEFKFHLNIPRGV